MYIATLRKDEPSPFPVLSDEAQVKPYFPLDRMTEAAFDCAGRLFGLKFVENTVE